MARDLTTQQSNELAGQRLDYFLTVQIDFSSETSYFWSGLGDKTIEGNTYVGVGNLLSIDRIKESSDFGAHDVKLSLSGVPTSLLSLALSMDYRNAKTTISQGLDSPNLDEFYKVVYVGFVDTMSIIEGKQTSIITITLENALSVIQRTAPIRYTNESHQATYPTDRGFEYVESLQNRAIAWGGEGNSVLTR